METINDLFALYEKYKVLLMVICIGVPLLIVIAIKLKQLNVHILLSKIFNMRKALKDTKVKPVNPVKSEKANDENNMTFLGVSSTKKEMYIPDNAKHVFVCGTTGSGKTVALANFVKSAVDNDYPALIVDGKGDIGENSLIDIVQKLSNGKKKLYIVNMNNSKESDKYNPFKGANPSVIKDMLINMTEWSEEHYKFNTERYLQRLINTLYKTDISLSLTNIVKNMSVNSFTRLSAELAKNQTISKDEHMENVEIIKASGEIAERASSRFSTILESEIGTIFDESGVDIYTALKEKAIILFILNPLIYPEISPLFGRLILIDSKKAVGNMFGEKQRTFFIFDEINVYASPTLLDLVNKSRSASVTCILATQSLSDLDFASGEYFKEQIIENCNNYIVLRQNSAVNSEHWAKVLGTRKNLNVTYQISNKGGMTQDTGYGSARQVREFLYHPDEIKTFSTGKGIYMCKDNNTHCKITINKPF